MYTISCAARTRKRSKCATYAPAGMGYDEDVIAGRQFSETASNCGTTGIIERVASNSHQSPALARVPLRKTPPPHLRPDQPRLPEEPRRQRADGRAAATATATGWSPSPTAPSWWSINTCGFIGDARTESYETIEEMLRLKKRGRVRRVIVAGCLAERDKDEAAGEVSRDRPVDRRFRPG